MNTRDRAKQKLMSLIQKALDTRAAILNLSHLMTPDEIALLQNNPVALVKASLLNRRFHVEERK